MATTLPLRDWLRFIDAEYLSSFIKAGGASIKFAVTPEDLKPALYEAVEKRCAVSDSVVVKVDAIESRLHMPQDIFFSMARQVDWRRLARRFVLRLASDRGYRIDGVDPSRDDNVFGAVGSENGLDSDSVYTEFRPQIEQEVFKNRCMVKDFRVAMMHFCILENRRENDPYGGQPLIDWITGAVTRVSNVKPFLIHTSINRTTARHFIESALYWFHHAGHAGTVMLLDNSRVTLARNPRDGRRYYTRAMTVDHYECLREFVDATDQLTGALIMVVSGNEFLDESPGSKGYQMYPALKTRVMDDVRDKNLVNPAASLIRLS